MNKPILTIAVPTWNRASILDNALSALLSQINQNKDKIEIIISDNASDDNTNEVIKKHCEINTTLNIIHNTQPENTGYYGNFHKCRQLSNGAYFWLLSDNDFIANDLVDYILEILLNQKPSFVFLKDWKHASKVNRTSNFNNKTFPIFKGVEVFNYKTTLISAVIFKNDKRNDKELFSRFKGNTFLGFLFFLEALKDKSDVVEIKGTSLFIRDTKVSFNAFKSFAVDLIACFDYAVEKSILPRETAQVFINNTISELTVRHYILYRIKGSLHGQSHKREDVDELLNNGFYKYEAYKTILNPLQKAQGFDFYNLVFRKHLFQLIKNRLFR